MRTMVVLELYVRSVAAAVPVLPPGVRWVVYADHGGVCPYPAGLPELHARSHRLVGADLHLGGLAAVAEHKR